MKRILIFFFVFLFIIPSFSQNDTTIVTDTIWRKSGLRGLDFSQALFTNSAIGGQNTFTIAGSLNFFINYKKYKNTWDNTFDLGLGYTQLSNDLRKNEDKIDITTKYGRYAFKKYWYYSAILNFKSLFANGYNYPNDTTIISHFLAPANILLGLGLDYKPTSYLSLYLSPITARFVLVDDQDLANEGAFGVKPAVFSPTGELITKGEKLREEFGAYLRFGFKKDIFKNVNFYTKLELYSNYRDNPENVDVYWETITEMKVNGFISANFRTNLIYDHNVPIVIEEQEVNGVTITRTGPRLQFKEIFSIKFAYKF